MTLPKMPQLERPYPDAPYMTLDKDKVLACAESYLAALRIAVEAIEWALNSGDVFYPAEVGRSLTDALKRIGEVPGEKA